MTHDEVDRICDKLARAAKDARAKHKRNAELFGVGGSHQTQTWRLTTEAATLIRHLRDERDEALSRLAASELNSMQPLEGTRSHIKREARNKALDEAAAAIDNVDPMLAEVILALKTQVEKATIPPGYVLVPEKPTEAMLYEGEGYTDLVMPEGFPNTPEERRNEIACAWSAMIDVALGRGTADRIRARKAARVHAELAEKEKE